MNFIISIIRTLFRHRWLILVGTAIFTLLVFYYTRHMQGGYDVKATLYTGVASDIIWKAINAQTGRQYKIRWTT